MMIPYLLIVVGAVYYYNREKGIGYNQVYKVFYTKGRNIYTLGFGGNAKIMVGEELLSILTREEISALIYHERGHIVKHHILKNFIYLFIISIVATLLTYKANDLIGYVGVILFLITTITLFIFNSRLQEYIADTYATKFIHESFLLSALVKLDNYKYSITHPSYKQRAINLGNDEI